MRDIILLKQGEMVLKGLNKHRFDRMMTKTRIVMIKTTKKTKTLTKMTKTRMMNNASDP